MPILLTRDRPFCFLTQIIGPGVLTPRGLCTKCSLTV
ncbi:hypothetical protein CS5676_0026 [Clostridium phage phiCs5676-1]|nr:hypothetical protein CS5676_0026 [Clostridium phage phiCs5676-1]